MEYFTPPESFSTIENAKRNLEGLCVRFRVELQGRRVAERLSVPRNATLAQESEPHPEGAIRDLERGMLEFQGTEQELAIAEDLLRVLKQAGRFDRWIEVYLKALYEHPMNRVVASLAKEAISHGRAVGRERDVVAGLRHLIAIPLDFAGKEAVEAALIDGKPGNGLTNADSASCQ